MTVYKNGKPVEPNENSKKNIDWNELSDHVVYRIIIATEEFSYSHQLILKSAATLITKLRKRKIAVGKDNETSGTIYGAISLARVFTDTLESAILQIFPEGSFIHSSISINLKHPFPLSKYLSDKGSYLQLREIIHQASRRYRDYYRFDGATTQYITDCNSLELIMEILNCLSQLAPEYVKPKWCKVCFRRYPCSEHRTNFGDQNLEYENGRSIFRAISKESKQRWEMHRIQRKTIGESFNLISSIDEIENEHNGNSILIDKHMHELIKITESQPWTVVSKYWEIFIQVNFSELTNRLKSPITFVSLDLYITDVLIGLNNKGEQSKNPLWFLYMLDEANDWCITEQNKSIKTIDKILAYYPNVTTNLSEIAKKIGISRARVSSALKEYKLS